MIRRGPSPMTRSNTQTAVGFVCVVQFDKISQWLRFVDVVRCQNVSGLSRKAVLSFVALYFYIYHWQRCQFVPLGLPQQCTCPDQQGPGKSITL
jgi:hypothetical protein